jgi:hypothetical protein
MIALTDGWLLVAVGEHHFGGASPQGGGRVAAGLELDRRLCKGFAGSRCRHAAAGNMGYNGWVETRPGYRPTLLRDELPRPPPGHVCVAIGRAGSISTVGPRPALHDRHSSLADVS